MWFRIRSPARDETSDALRLSSIEQSISIAIAEAKSEKEGLRRRIENARARFDRLTASLSPWGASAALKQSGI
jgi:hypothetical protein